MTTDNQIINKINLSPFLFLLKGSFVLLLFHFLTRILFWGLNHGHFLTQKWGTIIYAFLHGIRFDASSIALLNAPLALLLFVFVWFKSWNRFTLNFTLCYFSIVNSFALIVDLIDSVYFPFTGRRSGLEVISMMRDVSLQGPQLLIEYWWLAFVIFTIVSAFIAIIVSMKNRMTDIDGNLGSCLLVCLIVVMGSVFLARGGLQAKPIRSLNAYSWPKAELGALVLNTSFTLMRETTSNMQPMTFYRSNLDAYNVIRKSEGKKETVANQTPQNVVVILLESFGLEYFGAPYGSKSYAPFLESLSEQGRFFPYGVANGRRSIEAIPSIFAGIPSLMPEAFMRSPYQSNKIYGLGEILKNHGYKTAFFHGANNGSMYFDDTTYRLGFDQYYGVDEYPNTSDFDGQWGIFDEPFLQFTADKLDEIKTPFLAGIFTISSHTPYTLPKQYESIIKDGEIPMHKVVQYTDIALKKFFETAKTKAWFENTLFIITADHTSDNFDTRFATPTGRHQIPIVLYHPQGHVKPQVVNEIAQQIDIPATVIDYLDLPERDKLMPFGRSLLRATSYDEAIIREEGAYWLMLNSQYIKLTFDGLPIYQEGTLPSTFMEKSASKKKQSEEVLRKRINAYVQLYTNGLIDNDHYPHLTNTTQ